MLKKREVKSIANVYNRFNLTFKRGEGAWLFDMNDDKYLDFTGGIAVLALGHSNPILINALTKQAELLWHCSNLFYNNLLEEVSDKLTNLCKLDTIFFTNSGVEAVEAAIKFTRRYFAKHNQGDKHEIITLHNAFHGRTLAAISLTDHPIARDGYAPYLEGFKKISLEDLSNSQIEKHITPKTAAIMLEPILGEGGIFVIKPETLKEIRRICDKHGLLMIIDEVQTGISRTGSFLYHQRADIRPDILILAKGMGGGFPVGATLITQEISATLNPGCHGGTYNGNLLALSVVNEVLNEVIKPAFLENVAKVGNHLKMNLNQLQQKYPHIIKEIRGEGLMLGLEIKQPLQARVFAENLQTEHLLTSPCYNNVIRLLPPLNIDIATADQCLERLESGLKKIL